MEQENGNCDIRIGYILGGGGLQRSVDNKVESKQELKAPPGLQLISRHEVRFKMLLQNKFLPSTRDTVYPLSPEKRGIVVEKLPSWCN